MAAALALAEILPRTEGSRDVLSLNFENDTARTFYSAVAGGMIAFTGLVVSIAVVVVQFGASQYTPRLVSRFRRDPIVKHALGAFIAPAIFSLISLGSIGRNGATVVPSVAITVALALLLGAVLAFYGLVGRLLDLLRPRRIVGQIVDHAATGDPRGLSVRAARRAAAGGRGSTRRSRPWSATRAAPAWCPRSIARASCGPRRRPEP